MSLYLSIINKEFRIFEIEMTAPFFLNLWRPDVPNKCVSDLIFIEFRALIQYKDDVLPV